MSEGVVPLPPKLAREKQVFPMLTPAQIARLVAHGRARSVREGEILLEAGDHVVPLFIVGSGELEIVRVAGESQTPVAWLTAGQFTGEVNMIAGRRALLR